MCNNTSKPALDWGKPLQTTDGRDAVLLTKEYQSGNGIRYVVMVTGESGMSMLHNYFPNGEHVAYHTPTLRNKTRKVKKWYNLWTHNPGSQYYDDHAVAYKAIIGRSDYLATLSIEIEEPL
jgi:hypothetical protein